MACLTEKLFAHGSPPPSGAGASAPVLKVREDITPPIPYSGAAKITSARSCLQVIYLISRRTRISLWQPRGRCVSYRGVKLHNNPRQQSPYKTYGDYCWAQHMGLRWVDELVMREVLRPAAALCVTHNIAAPHTYVYVCGFACNGTERAHTAARHAH
jgi:hypothetical protein